VQGPNQVKTPGPPKKKKEKKKGSNYFQNILKKLDSGDDCATL
jgi:hypothetical protein